VLDVATGGGDIPLALARMARRRGVSLHIAGCDISERATRFAQARAAALDLPVEYFRHDVLREPVPGGWDAVLCSLFLHHLERSAAVEQLSRMGAAATRLLMVSDLRRTVPGYALAHLATRVLSRSPVVWTDGPRSVRAAFSLGEARAIAVEAGLGGARVRRVWPARWLLTWRPA
jgi:2-polyprenyl-3-methyl-5-hydroxy-6-metoxy-1,4-benzoquinol methylase